MSYFFCLFALVLWFRYPLEITGQILHAWSSQGFQQGSVLVLKHEKCKIDIKGRKLFSWLAKYFETSSDHGLGLLWKNNYLMEWVFKKNVFFFSVVRIHVWTCQLLFLEILTLVYSSLEISVYPLTDTGKAHTQNFA